MGSQPSISTNNRIATALAYVITAAWGVSFTVDIFVRDYEPSPSVHALMMIVAGAVFGEGLIRKRVGDSIPNGNGQKNQENKDDRG